MARLYIAPRPRYGIVAIYNRPPAMYVVVEGWRSSHLRAVFAGTAMSGISETACGGIGCRERLGVLPLLPRPEEPGTAATAVLPVLAGNREREARREVPLSGEAARGRRVGPAARGGEAMTAALIVGG